MKYTIIVTDYKRKIYILDALRSIKEGINLNDLELVVVKYYEDEKVDNYIKQNFPNYKIINLNPNEDLTNVGYMFYIGIKNSSNNLIFLLDDDDLFRKDKIKTILGFIKKKKLIEKNINFLIHNNWIKFYSKSIKIRKEKIPAIIKLKLYTAFNHSSMTLFFRDNESKKLFLKYLDKINFSVDLYSYSFFLQYGKVFQLSNILTLYRCHDKNVSKNKNIQKELKFMKDGLYIAKLFPKYRKFIIRYGLFRNKMIINVYNKEKVFNVRFFETVTPQRMYYYLLYRLKKYDLLMKKL